MRDFPIDDNKDTQPHTGRGHGKRYFGRGGVKRALLGLLASEPMHGYQMIKALEEQSGGLYVPSAGSIYPTLQMLEDRELISSQLPEGSGPGTKKVYSITEAGLTILHELQDSHRHGHDGRHPRFIHGPEGEAYRHEKIRRKLGLSTDMYQVIRQLAAAEEQAAGSPAKKQELNRVVAALSVQLSTLLSSERKQDHSGVMQNDT